jgi:ankyrin repeat protein
MGQHDKASRISVRNWLRLVVYGLVLMALYVFRVPIFCFSAAVDLRPVVRAYLVLGMDPDVDMEAVGSPLGLAVSAGHEEMIELLVRFGADIDRMDWWGEIPLTIAAHDQPELVGMLLDLGADINAGNDYGVTALHRAADTGAINAMETLLEAGADVNARNSMGQTPLMYASISGNAEIARFLLRHGAEVNAVSSAWGFCGGVSALLLASSDPHAETIRVLLDAGANVNQADRCGQSPLMKTVTTYHVDDSEATELLIEHGSNVDQKDENGNTPLMWAVMCHNANAVRLLLDGEADVNMRNNNGVTALTLAVRRGEEKVANMLIQAGAVE